MKSSTSKTGLSLLLGSVAVKCFTLSAGFEITFPRFPIIVMAIMTSGKSNKNLADLGISLRLLENKI